MELKQFDAATLAKAISEKEATVMVEFYTDSCPFCKSLERVFCAFAAEYPTGMVFGKVNLGTEPSLTEQYGIRSVPTVILFSDGVPIGRCTGAVNRGRLEELARRVESDGAGWQKNE